MSQLPLGLHLDLPPPDRMPAILIDSGHKWRLQPCSNSASKSIFNIARSCPPSSCLSLLHYRMVIWWSTPGVQRYFRWKNDSGFSSIPTGREYMTLFPAMRNHTIYMDLQILSKSMWDQEQGNKELAFLTRFSPHQVISTVPDHCLGSRSRSDPNCW